MQIKGVYMPKYNHTCENKECKKQFTNWKIGTRFCCMACRSYTLTKVVVCDNCGKEKRKPLSDIFAKSKHNFCGIPCKRLFFVGSRSPLYNMGEKYIVESTGMTYIWCKDKYRAEHRILTENFIGRKLATCSEPILHINGINSDNKLANLYVCESKSEMAFILKNHDVPYPYKSNLKTLKDHYEHTNKKD